MRLGIFDVLFTTVPRHKVEIKKYEFKIVEKLVNSGAGMELPPEISDGFNAVVLVLGISFKYSRNTFSSPKERTWGSGHAGPGAALWQGWKTCIIFLECWRVRMLINNPNHQFADQNWKMMCVIIQSGYTLQWGWE